MATNAKAKNHRVPEPAALLKTQYGCGPVQFAGTHDALYERHLLFDIGLDPASATARDQFEALARSVRDILSQRWLLTDKTYEQQNPKRLYYLSLEFLIGRSLADNGLDMYPRTSFFAGKAAPAYRPAKLIIKFINNLAAIIDTDHAIAGRLKVVFLPEYCVSLAEHLIPASEVSNQISTAGYEASGTSNMKFMMNGALTIGTRDGATIEMAAEAGAENFFLFGLTAEHVMSSRAWYRPQWHYENDPEIREALDLIASNHFSEAEPGIFAPLCDALLTQGDHYLHLADLKSYLKADERLRGVYADPDAWARKAIVNVAGSGRFSSDRTISLYASEIWNLKPCRIPGKCY